MDFDRLLRKYLTGTLSDVELAMFRDLLEKVPEYKVELRQILELRSVLHDDALTLVPPVELSESIRMAVGERFAYAAQEEEEKKRRAIPLYWRLSGSSIAVAVAAAIMALAPLFINPFNNIGPQNILQNAPLAATVQLDKGEAITVPPVTLQPTTQPQSSSRTPIAVTDVAVTPPTSTDATSALASLGATEQEAFVPTPATLQNVQATEIDNSTQFADAAMHNGTLHNATQPRSVVLLPERVESVEANLSLMGQLAAASSTLALGSFGDALSRDDYIRQQNKRSAQFAAISAKATTGEDQAESIEEHSRLFTLGVTLGSGNVSNAETPVAILQNSYYFSFGVTDVDRIGVEMGGSTFSQNKQITDYRSTDGLARQTAGSPGNTVEEAANETRVLPSQSIASIRRAQAEQQVTYGAIFYDRRIEVAREWDLCGRLAVGGADDAVLGNVRLYGAYTPTKNVTLTMGVGGSTIHKFSTHESEGNLNYGVYYGIETGF